MDHIIRADSPAGAASQLAAVQRRWWDDDAARYHAAHERYLAGFNWCPEMLSEHDARLLGDVAGQRILEVGCGSAPCSTWLATQGPELVVGCDISQGMLRRAAPDTRAHLIQADAQFLPFAAATFDTVFSVFGALPFVPDVTVVLRQIHRVLRPGGRCVFSVTHPMRWVFSDDPACLTAALSYFEREYIERDTDGTITYAEYHRTFGDWIRAIREARLMLVDVVEPEWPHDLTETWGQWSPQRGKIFPGTAIFLCEKPVALDA